jgi:NAD(P)-dependent dehydrogenase (short-subunit alcohol dehydrogenase family)
MAKKKVWLVTGAGRGMGVDIAKAALAAGYAVVATGRSPERVAEAVGASDDLLTVRLDVTDPANAEAAVQAAVDRFARIDVLVNNAGNFYAGFFEEITPQDFRAQVETNLFGSLNVARAVLPVMRKQRSGLVVAISSTAGITGGQFVSAYAAAKFAVEGWIESLTPEVAPFGIRTMLVEPGFFRTELLTPESTSYAEPSIDDYADRTRQTVTAWNAMNGLQGGDPAKLATALVQLASSDEPPQRWAAGADAVNVLEQKAKDLLAQADAHRELSSSLAHHDGTASVSEAAGRHLGGARLSITTISRIKGRAMEYTPVWGPQASRSVGSPWARWASGMAPGRDGRWTTTTRLRSSGRPWTWASPFGTPPTSTALVVRRRSSVGRSRSAHAATTSPWRPRSINRCMRNPGGPACPARRSWSRSTPR